MSELTIVDVSENNGNIVWQDVAKAVDGAIIRVGYRGWGGGNIVTDHRAREYLVLAQAQGLPLGLYFVTQAVTESEAIAEANACAEMAKDIPLRLPVFFDSELAGGANGRGRADNLSVQQRTDLALAFAKRIRELGYRPGVYCSDNWLITRLQGQRLRSEKICIWVASYPGRPGLPNVPPKSQWDGWQYTDQGDVAGIKTLADLSYFDPDEMEGRFSDTAGHWAEKYIERVCAAGLMNGKSERTFAPQDVLTRAELATVMARLLDRMEGKA